MTERYLIRGLECMYLAKKPSGFEWTKDRNEAYRWEKRVEAEAYARYGLAPFLGGAVVAEQDSTITHKRRLVVTFELEVRDDYYQEREVKPEEDGEEGRLLSDIATYLACRVENHNEWNDPYWLRDGTVYWIGEFMEAVAQGEVTTFEEDDDG